MHRKIFKKDVSLNILSIEKSRFQNKMVTFSKERESSFLSFMSVFEKFYN